MTAVALDVTAVPADPVGAGQYTLALAHALATRGAVDLVLLARRDDAARWEAVAPGAHVVAAAPPGRVLRLGWEQLALPRVLGRLAPDVHHGPHYTMPERARLPRVVTIHDLTFIEHPEWHERTKVPVFRRAIRIAAQRADALVCVSTATAERLDALCSPRAPVTVIHHGVDHARFTPVADPAADRALLARAGVRPPYIAFLGTLEPRKNVPGLVRAFDALAKRHPDVRLVLAGGRGWGSEAVDEAVAGARHGDRVVRTGYVPAEVAPALLRQAAAVAYPAFEEGFGLPALEALACGAPLVTTRGTPMEEVSGGAALLVEPGDERGLAEALDELLRGGPAVEARRRQGIDTARRFTWDASAAGHEAVYEAVG